jgi:hypothetical protein
MFCALPLFDDGVVATCVSTCAALLAAALIVLSLLNLQASGSESFRVELEARRDRALSVVRIVQLTIWLTGLGALEGLVALAFKIALLRVAALALAFLATAAFLAMSAKTVSAVVSSARED